MSEEKSKFSKNGRGRGFWRGGRGRGFNRFQGGGGGGGGSFASVPKGEFESYLMFIFFDWTIDVLNFEYS